MKVKRKHQKAAAKEKPATEPRRTGNKSELEAEPKIEPKVEPKIGPKVEPKIEPKVEPENEPKAEPKTELKETEPKVESNAGQIEKTSETASGQDARTLRIDEDGIDVEVSVDGEPSEIVHIPAELGQALKLSLIAEEKKKAASPVISNAKKALAQYLADYEGTTFAIKLSPGAIITLSRFEKIDFCNMRRIVELLGVRARDLTSTEMVITAEPKLFRMLEDTHPEDVELVRELKKNIVQSTTLRYSIKK